MWSVESKKPTLETCFRERGGRRLADAGVRTGCPAPCCQVRFPSLLCIVQQLSKASFAGAQMGRPSRPKRSGLKPQQFSFASSSLWGRRKEGVRRPQAAEWPQELGSGARLGASLQSLNLPRDPFSSWSRSTCGHCLPSVTPRQPFWSPPASSFVWVLRVTSCDHGPRRVLCTVVWSFVKPPSSPGVPLTSDILGLQP